MHLTVPELTRLSLVRGVRWIRYTPVMGLIPTWRAERGLREENDGKTCYPKDCGWSGRPTGMAALGLKRGGTPTRTYLLCQKGKVDPLRYSKVGPADTPCLARLPSKGKAGTCQEERNPSASRHAPPHVYGLVTSRESFRSSLRATEREPSGCPEARNPATVRSHARGH